MNKISRRSLLHFAVLIIYAIGMTLFLLQKAEEAIQEINRLQIY